MIDTYSKVVLTIIAAALSVIATQQAVSPANAFSDCGSARLPCFVMSQFPLEVYIK